MLVHHTDSQGNGFLRRTDIHFFASQIDFTRVRLINAGQHIHQRGFARAVFAKQGQNFALADVQIDPIVGDHRAEALCQPV